MKLSSATVINAGGSWSTERTDYYGYDAQRDFLINETLTGNSWSYDPAGNRNDVSVDNLNRITKTGSVSATSDILGNVVYMGETGYSWDCLNRMTEYIGQGENYVYRADGMRVSKSTTFNNQNKSTTYRCDGQMGIKDVDVNNGATTVTDYAVGARGIDAISVTNSSGTSVSYPPYDAHGNMISTLSKGTGGTYSWATERVYDAWGTVTSGNGSGDPKGRYCANLGHNQDDESGLIYMRARYYDPAHGRFMSQDPGIHGRNWPVYCAGDPVNFKDESGKNADSDWLMLLGGIFKLIGVFLMGGGFCLEFACLPAAIDQTVKLALDYKSLTQAFRNFGGADSEVSEWQEVLDQIQYFGEGVLYGKNTGYISASASGALLAVYGYYMCCQGELWQIEAGD